METKSFLLAKAQQMSIFSFQAVILLNDKKQYLRAINILIGEEVVDKIHLEAPYHHYTAEYTENLVRGYLLNSLKGNPTKDKAKKKTSRKSKASPKWAPNNFARQQAANDLMSNLNI